VCEKEEKLSLQSTEKTILAGKKGKRGATRTKKFFSFLSFFLSFSIKRGIIIL
jgi:hypothetical protein